MAPRKRQRTAKRTLERPPKPTPPSTPPRRRKLRTAAAIFVASLILYLANGKTVPFDLGGDSVPNRLIPFSILRHGTVTMDPFRDAFARHGGYRWYVQERRDRLVSYYPIGTPIVALPVFAPVYLWQVATGHDSAVELFEASEQAEKLAASALTAMAVVLVWLALLRRTTARRATWTALILATCSLLWPVASQVLWQHTAGALLLACALLLTAGPAAGWRPFLLGLTFGLWFAVRPQAALFGLGAAAGLFFAARELPLRRRLQDQAWFAAGVLICAIPTLAYNRYFYGNWVGGYAMASELFSFQWILGGLSGLLFSPNRGLLVLMPVAAVGMVGAWRQLRHPAREPMLSGLLVAAILYAVVHAATRTWAGGWCFGPRYLTESLPLLAVCSTATLVNPRRITKVLLALAVCWSFVIQLSGAWFYPASNWNARMGPDLERAAWDFGHFVPWEDYQAWRRRPRN